jgi:hypothetical protein
MIEIMGEFIVKLTGIVDCAEGLGVLRLVHVSSRRDSLMWGVALGGHIITGRADYFTFFSVAGVLVTPILIISSYFSSPRLLSPELSPFSANLSFNHRLANLPHVCKSLNLSNSFL